MNNNPLNHTDPTGHDENGSGDYNHPTPQPSSGDRCAASNGYAPGCSGAPVSGNNSSDGATSAESGDGNYKRDATLTEISDVFQDVATSLSGIGAGMEDAGLALGGPEGFAAGTILYHETGLNTASSVASVISTTATIINEHGLDDKSSTSLLSTLAGAISPIANIDLTINAWESAYNRGQAPGIHDIINTASNVISSVVDIFK